MVPQTERQVEAKRLAVARRYATLGRSITIFGLGLHIMKAKGLLLTAAMTAFFFSQPASAGVFTDEFAKCLVSSSSQDDQTQLAQWIFSAMTVHPSIQSMSKVTAEERAKVDAKTADLFVRLITKDCKSQSINALKNEGDSAMEAAFSVLGQVAMRRLMGDPQVVQSIQGFGKLMEPELKKFGKDNHLAQ